MTSPEAVNSALDHLCSFVNSFEVLVNCHMVNFITNCHWDNVLPSMLRQSLMQISVKQLHDMIFIAWSSTDCHGLENLIENVSVGSLTSFLQDIAEQKIVFDNLLSTVDEVLEKHVGFISSKIVPPSSYAIMSQKKSHEVQAITGLAAALATGLNADHMLELGSGKGYLGANLAFHYDLDVIGIDASQSNSVGAKKRIQNLKNNFGFSDLEVKNTGRHNLKNGEERNLLKVGGGNYRTVTGFVTRETDLEALTTSSADASHNEQSNRLWSHLTNEDGMQIMSPSSSGGTKNQLGLVGLHTCGDLTPTALQLFSVNSSVKFICLVGCCYHLLSEKIQPVTMGDLYEHENVKTDSSTALKTAPDSRYQSAELDPLHPWNRMESHEGFPLSKKLCAKRFTFTRNARMLASHSFGSDVGKEMKSIFWRSLLQHILMEKLGHVPTGTKVGRVASKCSNFKQYWKAAVSKLKLSIIITDDELENYEKIHRSDEEILQRFFLLRVSLAPIIEAIILLDQLSYLLEQKETSAAHLVKLFDPSKSPRCFALVAVKN